MAASDFDTSTKSLLISGFLWSGSSAVVDLLGSLNSVGVLPGEFDEFRRPGMVADHLEGLISEFYPSMLPLKLAKPIDLRQLIPFDRMFRFRSRPPNTKIRHNLLVKLARTINDHTLNSNQKRECAAEWLSSLKKQFAPGKSYLLIDQPIIWGQHSCIWPEFYDPFLMIVVARNPLDQIAEVMRQQHLFLHFRSPEADIWGGGRSGAFDYVRHTLLCRIIHYQKIRELVGQDKILFLKFEDLVNDTDAVMMRIARFLKVDVADIRSSTAFQPEVSRKNIGIYKKILTTDEIDKLETVMQLFEANYDGRFRLKTEFDTCGPCAHTRLYIENLAM